MTNSEKKALKQDLAFGYTNWMQQIHIKWAGKIDQTELRIEVVRILLDHALTRMMEQYRRDHKKSRKAKKEKTKVEKPMWDTTQTPFQPAEVDEGKPECQQGLADHAP